MTSTNEDRFPKVGIVLPYFGSFPSTWPLTLQSMASNPQIDWLLFTDQRIDDVPANVKVYARKFTDMKELVDTRLGISVALSSPYKFCDLKPAFGFIFEHYLRSYEYWGYCDADVVFGELQPHIEKGIASGAERLFRRGHLSLLPNTTRFRNLFRNKVPGIDWEEAFTRPDSRVFDEVGGWYDILDDAGVSTFEDEGLFDVLPDSFRLKAKSAAASGRELVYAYRNQQCLEISRSTGETVRVGRYIHLQKRPLRVPLLAHRAVAHRTVFFAPTQVLVSDSVSAGLAEVARIEHTICSRMSWTSAYMRRRSRQLLRRTILKLRFMRRT